MLTKTIRTLKIYYANENYVIIISLVCVDGGEDYLWNLVLDQRNSGYKLSRGGAKC